MNQALHIFRKDVRHLWIEIAAVLVLAAAFAIAGAARAAQFQASGVDSRNLAWNLFPLLFPVAWWILIVRVIHDETLAGDRQFWTTRPYRWPSLLAAKALFIASFVCLPLLAAQSVIVAAHGFALGPLIPGLLWNQVMLAAVVLLPIAALASLTRGFAQILLICLGAVLAFVVLIMAVPALNLPAALGALTWIPSYASGAVAAAGAIAVIAWQYCRRQTLTGVALALVGLALVWIAGQAIPWSVAWSLQSHLAGQPPNSPPINCLVATKGHATPQDEDKVRLSLPLHVDLPDSVNDRIDRVAVDVQAPDGSLHSLENASLFVAGKSEELNATIDGPFFRAIRDQQVTLHGQFHITLYNPPRATRIPFDGRRMAVPDMGICTAIHPQGPQGTHILTCVSALRPRADRVQVFFLKHSTDVPDTKTLEGSTTAPGQAFSYSPFPAEISIDPITRFSNFSPYPGPLDSALTQTRVPVAHVTSTFALPNLRLADLNEPQIRHLQR
jgi:hypothetical protein